MTENVRKYKEALDEYIGKRFPYTKDEKEYLLQSSSMPSIYKEIMEVMRPGTNYTLTDLMERSESLNEYSNQRVSATLRQMVDRGYLEREEIRRRAYFSLRDYNELNALLQEKSGTKSKWFEDTKITDDMCPRVPKDY